jgi:hypothetical protein
LSLYDYGPLPASLAAGAFVLVVAFVLRYVPHFIAPLGIGVDHWFWKSYIERYRQEGKFPPHLPQYLLDVAQWYPPTFPLLLSMLPRTLFDRFSHVVAILIDLARATSLMAMVYSLTRGNAIAVAVAGGAYAVTPLLISYNVQLNPRGLGAILLDLAFFSATLLFFFKAPPWLWWVLIPAIGLLLLTHKMTTQLFWFLCIVGGIFLDWRLAALIPLSIMVALVFSFGFYWKVLIAHWDIVSFWYRNWRWLGANPVLESPIYGSSTYETPRKMHRSGLAGALKHLFMQSAYNPFAWLLLGVLVLNPLLPVHLTGFPLYIAGGLALTLAFALATALVPFMRCLGAGHLYLYNAALASSLVWGLLYHGNPEQITPLLVAGAAASIVAIARFYLHVKQSPTIKVDSDFQAVLAFLSSRPKAAVMCVPPQWYDVIAYRTGLPVLYGGHGYGFRKLESTYPRLLVPLAQLIEQFGSRYIVYEKGAITDKFLADVPKHTAQDFGKYRVLCVEAGRKEKGPP